MTAPGPCVFTQFKPVGATPAGRKGRGRAPEMEFADEHRHVGKPSDADVGGAVRIHVDGEDVAIFRPGFVENFANGGGGDETAAEVETVWRGRLNGVPAKAEIGFDAFGDEEIGVGAVAFGSGTSCRLAMRLNRRRSRRLSVGRRRHILSSGPSRIPAWRPAWRGCAARCCLEADLPPRFPKLSSLSMK